MSAPLRRSLHKNRAAASFICPDPANTAEAYAFHRQLPGYAPTQLIPLPDIAAEVGVGHVYVKDEGDRLGLPAFKILGASWATMTAMTRRLGLESQSDLASVKAALKRTPMTLFAATDGNHGRAVARMGSMLGVPVIVYVPVGLHASTLEAIREEGCQVFDTGGDYDHAVQEVFTASNAADGILIQDFAFPGYEEIAAVS
jgi:diaminopropionate ammonia-lyase family